MVLGLVHLTKGPILDIFKKSIENWGNFEAAILLHPHENQSKFLVRQGLVKILMSTLVSSPKQQLRKHIQHSVCVLFDNLTFYELLGTFDNNGLECPTACPPVYCGKDMKSCYGGDDGNGCMWPNVCSPIDLECPTM